MPANRYLRFGLEACLLLSILLIAVFLRFHQIDMFPVEFSYDEWQESLDAMEMQEIGLRVFVPTNYGREALFTSILSLLFRLWEPQDLVLRVFGAFNGTLAVLVSYFLVREMFWPVLPTKAPWIAALTSLSFATAYWQIHLTRIGLRHTLLPLLISLTFYFLWRGLNTKRRWAFIIAGLMLGLSLYTYPAARFIPILLGLFFLFEAGLRWWEGHPKTALGWVHRYNLIILGLSAVIAVAPLGFYFLFERPDLFFNRANRISVFNQGLNENGPLLAFGQSVIGNLGGLFIHGAENPRFNIPGRPIFDPLMAGAFLLGLIIVLKRIRQPVYLFVFLWWPVMMAPAFLVYDWIPTFKRVIGMAPGLYILPALAWVTLGTGLLGWVRQHRPMITKPVILGLLVALSGVYALEIGLTYRDYFLRWGPSHAYYEHNLAYQTLAGKMHSEGRSDELWLFPIDIRTKVPRYHRLAGLAAYPDLPPNMFITVDEMTMFDQLNQALQDYSRVVLVNMKVGQEWEADHKHILPFLLEIYGERVETYTTADFDLIYYTLNKQVEISEIKSQGAVQWQPMNIQFDAGLTLASIVYGDASGLYGPNSTQIPSGGKLWAVLRWQIEDDLTEDYSTSLRLTTLDGYTIGQNDKPLINRWHERSSAWRIGEDVFEYYLVSTETGLAPDNYNLEVQVYNTTALTPLPATIKEKLVLQPVLEQVEVRPAPNQMLMAEAARFDDFLGQWFNSLTLLEVKNLPQAALRPGDQFHLALLWRGKLQMGDNLMLHLGLASTSSTLTVLDDVLIGSDTYPTGLWREEELIKQWLPAQLPPDLQNGTYILSLSPEFSQDTVALGQIEIQGRPRVFQLPADVQVPLAVRFGEQIELVGLTLSSPETDPAETRGLTLYWRGLSPLPANYKVFVHVLDKSGHILAQNDQIPAAGEAPTTSWLANEVIIDSHELNWPVGADQLAIGLYQPETGQRLSGSALAEGRFIFADF